MTDKPIIINCGGNGRVATRWKNTAGVGERPRLVAVEWREKTKEDRRRRSKEAKVQPPVKRGLVQGSLL